MEKLKNNIVTKKAELKAEGVSGGQINKDSEIVEWVNKLNALKEKEAQLKGDMSANNRGSMSVCDQFQKLIQSF